MEDSPIWADGIEPPFRVDRIFARESTVYFEPPVTLLEGCAGTEQGALGDCLERCRGESESESAAGGFALIDFVTVPSRLDDRGFSCEHLMKAGGVKAVAQVPEGEGEFILTQRGFIRVENGAGDIEQPAWSGYQAVAPEAIDAAAGPAAALILGNRRVQADFARCPAVLALKSPADVVQADRPVSHLEGEHGHVAVRQGLAEASPICRAVGRLGGPDLGAAAATCRRAALRRRDRKTISLKRW